VRRQENRRPALDPRFKVSRNTREATASTPSNGSSRKSRSGLGISAAASASFFHAVGELDGQFLFFVRQVHHGEQLIAALSHRVFGKQIHAADESQIFTGGKILKETEILGHNPDPAFHFPRLRPITHVFAENANRAARWRQQPGQHLDRGRLSRAIGPEKTVELPGFPAQINSIDGAKIAEPPRQLRGFDAMLISVGRVVAKSGRVIAIITVFGVKSIEVPRRQSQSRNEMNARQVWLSIWIKGPHK
jgi:hypothetical protein